jgi:hypothetical protein
MKKLLLTVPQLMFIVGTRAILAAGVALLASGRMSKRTRRILGTTLAAAGAAATIPAARILASARPSLLNRIAHRLHR